MAEINRIETKKSIHKLVRYELGFGLLWMYAAYLDALLYSFLNEAVTLIVVTISCIHALYLLDWRLPYFGKRSENVFKEKYNL